MQAGNPPHHEETQRDGTDSNLVILRASRLEALVPPLMAQLRQLQPDKLLAAQTVVAAHPGMKQWLAGAMARQAGPGGIVANIDVLLPSSWLDRLARERLGDQAVALPAWQRRQLRWSVHAALQSSAVPGLADPRISRYLGADQADSMAERERRRFQLADRLAAVYSQYLVYRPDWLAAWEAGQWHFATARHADAALAALEQSLLAPLWKHLSRQLGPHRARVTEQLVQQLQQPDPQREPVHVFGLSHLPPAEMQVLRAWACHAPVFLYLPDPCREYWGGLRPPGARLSLQDQLARLPQWQQQEAERIEQAEGGDWLDETQNRDHPLLARWGRLGQHFYAQLADADALADIRHGEDEAPATANNQLQRLQHSIRQLDHALLHDAEPYPAKATGEDADVSRVDAWWQARRRDPSLRIHACHTRLRELEVLRDALLDALAAGIEPGRMVVMAPDIGAYAALLPAVFGSPGDPRERRLPWHLADAPLMRSHRLFSTVTRLLEAGSQRFSATEIADLLGVPEIARALGLDPAAHTALLGWLGDSRAAWALDATHRQRFGVPPAQMHTLAWGVDRMLAGYVMGDAVNPGADTAVQLPDGSTLLPLSGVHGPASSGVGALDLLLCELQRWQALTEAEQTASAWVDTLTRRLETLLRIDPQDADAAAAWSAIRALLARIGQEPAQAGQDPLLHFAVVRDLLLDALGSVPERQRFLMGGITFCGMVPQRAIPFDMVCVLGLDDGEFPRQSRDGGIDLMARLRRLGDRDVRTDDRWLFLETLMSARQRLHLSWLGQSARDGKPRNPAAPLAELMSELEQATGSQGRDDEQARPWLLRHPLQAFDARYFDGSDPALFSYSQAFARMQGEGNAQLPSFLQAGVGTPAQTPDPAPERLPLRALTRFWKAPAEDLLGKRLQLDLAALQDDTLDASEPLEARLSKRETVARRVFFRHALPAGRDAAGTPRWSPQPIPAWVEHAGLLPPGELGRQAWRSEAEAVLHLLHAATEHEVPLQETDNLAVDIALPAPDDSGHAVRLQGNVAQLLPLADGAGWQLLRAFPDKGELKAAGNLHLGERLVMFIEWAALRLHTGDMAPAPALHLTVLAKGELELARQIRAWDAVFLAEPLLRATRLHVLRERLATLLRLWWQAAIQPPLYFPHTSSAVLDADNADAAAKQAAAAFESGFNRTGEREHAPGWTRLLAGGIGFDPRQDAAAGEHLEQLLAYARQLEALMQLTEAPPAETEPGQAA